MERRQAAPRCPSRVSVRRPSGPLAACRTWQSGTHWVRRRPRRLLKRTRREAATIPAVPGAVLASLLAIPSLAAEDEIRRAANGKPDLTGTYDAGTLTPLERPEKYGDNLFLTAEEAEKIEAEAARRLADLHKVGDPNREPPPAGGDGSGGGAGNVGGYSGVWRDLGIEASPVDGRFRTSIVIDPPNGRVPRMTEAGEARMAEQARRDRPNDGAA